VNRSQREYYKRDYAQAKAEGKPFFPYAVYKDLLIATLAIAVVITLAIWHRVEVGEPVNPASTDFVPRPEWYFFFLFELLKIFKGENALTPVIMATFVIPNILMALLILTPFIDRSPERRLQRRPIALFSGIAVVIFLCWLTYKGGTSEEGVGAEGLQLTGLESDAAALAGSELWLANCTSCHMIKNVGQPGPGPNLTEVGTKNVISAETAEEFLQNPPPGMPTFANFTAEEYTQLGTFLGGLGTTYK